jgi:hypothetical protein
MYMIGLVPSGSATTAYCCAPIGRSGNKSTANNNARVSLTYIGNIWNNGRSQIMRRDETIVTLALDNDDILRTARLSDDGKYRWILRRYWGGNYPKTTATFIMLNPSTANATHDDPTVRRCIRYAQDWGCHGLSIVNLYAYRATKPVHLWQADDPVGAGNNRYITAEVDRATIAVAAWGTLAKPQRVKEVLALPGMDRLHVLGLTKHGHPRHPLYIRAGVTPQPWEHTP